MTERILIGLAIVALIGMWAAIVALRRLGDILEAVNHALERIAVEQKRR